jgi:hypothetical protein
VSVADELSFAVQIGIVVAVGITICIDVEVVVAIGGIPLALGVINEIDHAANDRHCDQS